MPDWLLSLDLAAAKPLLTALVLPPVPWLALILAGAWMLRRRPASGWSCVLIGVAGLWLSCTTAVGEALLRPLVAQHPALTAQQVQALRGSGPGAIVVLGGGRDAYAPEYDAADLTPLAAARLRYGLWLAAQTGWPVAFSGGVGHASRDGAPEARIAAEVAQRDFGRKLRWVEAESRDTRENAERSVALLHAAGVRQLVIVTHGWHMPRSLRAFRAAAQRQQVSISLVPAPMGLAADDLRGALRWLPSWLGLRLTTTALREQLGWLVGA